MRTLQRSAATPASPHTRDPDGSSICTSIDSPPPHGVNCRHPLGALTSNLPWANATWVCSAADASPFLAGSLGPTSTMVSVRSLAAIRMSPTPSSTVTEMGSGVSNVGIDIPPLDLRALVPPGVLKSLLYRLDQRAQPVKR